MSNLIEIPDHMDVPVPKLGRSVRVPVGTAAEDVVLHLIMHGIKQKLVDSTAGINAADYPDKDAYSKAVDEAVSARLATVLTIPSERAFGPRNPVETEARRLVAAFLLKVKVASKAADAAERTSTFAKAQEAFGSTVGAMARKSNPSATDEQVAAVVARNWSKVILEPAEAEVARRKSAIDGMAIEV